MSFLMNGPFDLEVSLNLFLTLVVSTEATSCNAIPKSAVHEDVGVLGVAR